MSSVICIWCFIGKKSFSHVSYEDSQGKEIKSVEKYCW